MKINEKGFTLVEVMVASFIFPILFFSVFSLLNMASMISHTNDVFAELNQSAVQTLRHISREIAQTGPAVTPPRLVITAGANGNSIVRFQIPVDWDLDGDIIGNGTNTPVEWGVYDEAGQSGLGAGNAARPDLLNRWAQYSVNNQNQLVREILDGGLATIGVTQIVARNVSPAVGSFVVTPPATGVSRVTLTVRGTDSIGQSGSARVFADIPFSSDTLLRTQIN